MTLIGTETEQRLIVKNKNTGKTYKHVENPQDPSGKTYVMTETGSSAFEVKTENLVVEELHPSLDHSFEVTESATTEDAEWEAAGHNRRLMNVAYDSNYLIGSALVGIASGDLAFAIEQLQKEQARLSSK